MNKNTLYVYTCVLFQAPPGVKKNLQRTYESWSPEFVSRGGNLVRSQALFALSWFHAVMQERRTFIPQVQYKLYIVYMLAVLILKQKTPPANMDFNELNNYEVNGE